MAVSEKSVIVGSADKSAGGILIGKTNIPVMLADYQSNNPIFVPSFLSQQKPGTH